MSGAATGPSLARGRRPFVGVDARLLETKLVRSFSAQQRSVVLALYELANWGDAPWVWRGRQLGTVGRGELTHALRSIAEQAKVTKDVADGVVRALLRAGHLVEVLGAGGGPTTEPTPDATPRPTYKPTTPRKLRLVHFLRNGTSGVDEPTPEPTPEATPAPTPEPTEIRRTEAADRRSHPSPARRRRRGEAGADPRHRPLRERLEDVFLEVRGSPYAFQGGRDAKAVAELLRFSGGDLDQVEARWRVGLAHGDRWPGCSSIAHLAARWNELAPPRAASASPPAPLPAAGCPEWERVRSALQAKLREGPFRRWFAPLRGRIDGDALVLEAPDECHAAFVRDNYVAVLAPIAEQVLGAAFAVQVSTAEPRRVAGGAP